MSNQELELHQIALCSFKGMRSALCDGKGVDWLSKGRQFHSYLERAQVALGVDIQFDGGCVLLDGAPIDVNQTKLFIKTRLGQSFKGVLSAELCCIVLLQMHHFP